MDMDQMLNDKNKIKPDDKSDVDDKNVHEVYLTNVFNFMYWILILFIICSYRVMIIV